MNLPRTSYAELFVCLTAFNSGTSSKTMVYCRETMGNDFTSIGQKLLEEQAAIIET